VIKFVHWTIVVTLLLQALYCGFQVFVSMQPEGLSGPMWRHAADLPFEWMVVRRMYAIEGWVAFGALAIYLGVTELRPRLHREGP